MAPEPPQHVVIAGAGVVGTSTAYFLAKNYGVRTTLVDPTGTIAPAASGKAGGFLALDWNDYSPTGPLTRRSFALHQSIADDLGTEKIQYRRLTCASVAVGHAGTKPGGKKLEGIEWAQDEEASIAQQVRSLGETDTIAQVHPKLLCEHLWKATQEYVEGCTLVQGKVTGMKLDDDETFAAAELADGKDPIGADAILFACGPWTAQGVMTGVKYHSLVVPTDKVLSQCVFFSGCGDPEVYVRPDKTAYLTGFPDPAIRVKELPGQEEVKPDKIDMIRDSVRSAGSSNMRLDDDEALQNACYLPTTLDGIPMMGALQERCYVAAGHGCWGILMGPATGEAMADMIATGSAKSVDLSPFSPDRFGDVAPV